MFDVSLTDEELFIFMCTAIIIILFLLAVSYTDEFKLFLSFALKLLRSNKYYDQFI